MIDISNCKEVENAMKDSDVDEDYLKILNHLIIFMDLFYMILNKKNIQHIQEKIRIGGA